MSNVISFPKTHKELLKTFFCDESENTKIVIDKNARKITFVQGKKEITFGSVEIAVLFQAISEMK